MPCCESEMQSNAAVMFSDLIFLYSYRINCRLGKLLVLRWVINQRRIRYILHGHTYHTTFSYVTIHVGRQTAKHYVNISWTTTKQVLELAFCGNFET